MKYIITENRLSQTITKYLDELFDVKTIVSSHPEEWNSDDVDWDEDQTRIDFFYGTYTQEEMCFRWVSCDYYFSFSEGQKTCPEVHIDTLFTDKLNGYFGDNWKGPFKVWFTHNFDLPVKTVK